MKMSADSLRALQQKYGAKFMWVRRAGKAYVVRDQATLDRARAATQAQARHAAECDKRLCALADEAIKNGKATPAN